MPEIKANPDTLEKVGTDVVDLSRDIAGLKGKIGGISGGFEEPPKTAAALKELNGEWSAGLEALGNSVADVGRFAQGVGRLFSLVEGLLTGSSGKE